MTERSQLALTLTALVLAGCAEPPPQLFEVCGVELLAFDDAVRHKLTAPEAGIELFVPTCWRSMPESQIDNYFDGQPPGTFGDSNYFVECPNGYGGITASFINPTPGPAIALFSSTPDFPGLDDSCGLVYVGCYDRKYVARLGTAAELLQQRRDTRTVARGLQVTDIRVRNRVGVLQTHAIREKAFTTHVTKVSLLVGDDLWDFTLVGTDEHYQMALGRFVRLIYDADFRT